MVRVLLADDEETFALTTAELFRHHGHACTPVQCGQAALDELSRSDYDVLVTDVAMPGGDDLSFLRSVHEHAPTMPAVVVTGYPSMRSAVNAVRLSVVDYLIKPVDLQELLGSVVHAAARGEVLRELRDASVGSEPLRRTFDRLAHKPCLCPRHIAQSSSRPPA